MYTPKPINTNNVMLSEDLKGLVEQLAESTHDNWALGRIKSGWTYGPVRNDDLKQTPCLVPYSELSDEEKEYDRVTAMESLKAVLVLGFSIKRVSHFNFICKCGTPHNNTDGLCWECWKNSEPCPNWNKDICPSEEPADDCELCEQRVGEYPGPFTCEGKCSSHDCVFHRKDNWCGYYACKVDEVK